MSSKSNSETKRKLLTTHERLSSAYSMLCDSHPQHSELAENVVLVESILDLQAELRSLMAKVAKLHDGVQIG
jgi:hemoglobin-like flavoprotein